MRTQEAIKVKTDEISEVSKRIEGAKDELNSLVKQFDSFEICDDKFEDIFAKTSGLKPKFDNVLEEYQNHLVANTVYRFKFEDIPVDRFFGSFSNYSKVSFIITAYMASGSSYS